MSPTLRTAAHRAACTVVALAALTLFAACGGGGADDTPPPGSNPPALACLAMPSEVSWHADDTRSSEWKDVRVDWRNRIWLAGYDRGLLGQVNIEPGGDARGVLRLLSPAGEQLFDSGARLDSPGADVAEALHIDAGGRMAVAGRTTGVLSGGVNHGQFDLFVARLDATQPAAAWQLLQTGDERPQRPRRIELLEPGALVLAGLNDDHVPTNYLAEWSDTMAARVGIGADGTLSAGWTHRSQSTEPDAGAALAVHQGQVFVGGTVMSGPQRGMFVRKLGANGQPLWTARYTSIGLDRVAALVSLPDGSLLMAGSVTGSFRGGVSSGEQDLVVARISAVDGAVLWSTQLGSAGVDWLTDARVHAQGRIWLYGETEGGFVPGRAPAGSTDLFLLRLAADGTLQRAWQWGTAADEAATGVALDSCGRAVAVGSSGDGQRRRALVWFPQGQ